MGMNEIVIAGRMSHVRDATPALYLYNIMKAVKNNNQVIVKVRDGSETYANIVFSLLCWDGFMRMSKPVMKTEPKLQRVYEDEKGKKFVWVTISPPDGPQQTVKRYVNKRKFIVRGDSRYIQLDTNVTYKVWVLEKPPQMQV